MLVGERMSRPVISVTAETPIHEALALFKKEPRDLGYQINPTTPYNRPRFLSGSVIELYVYARVSGLPQYPKIISTINLAWGLV